MTSERKQNIVTILITVLLFTTLLLLPFSNDIKVYAYIVVYLIIGYEILFKAVVNIIHGQVFDENFLMSIASIGAFFVAEYPEAVSVMLFYRVGEFFQEYMLDKSRGSISDLLNIRPDYANVQSNGNIVKKDPRELNIGDLIIVKPGERIPIDGIVLKGNSTLDISILSGESMPKDVRVKDEVQSGCINISGLLTVKVTKPYSESTASKILELVEYAAVKKARTEKFITKFARFYTPVIVIVAILIAIFPPLFIRGEFFSQWIHRSLIFLVVSCPCALVISIPLGFFCGIGKASSKGILIKGGNFIESLSKAGVIIFDKTGTLTEGTFEVTKIKSKNVSEKELIRIAALAESYSNHPISDSLKKAHKLDLNNRSVRLHEEIPGYGVKATIDGEIVYAGNEKLMSLCGIKYINTDEVGTVVHVSKGGIYLGYIVISDILKKDSKKTIKELIKLRLNRIIMLTGDTRKVGERVAKELGINEVHTDLLPNDKVKIVEKILLCNRHRKKLIFVGDGINDAPALMRADIGIAMGGLGADSAVEAADIVIMDDNPLKIPEAIKISRKTLKIIKQNIVIAISIKILILILGVFDITNMWGAVFADVGVSIITIINSVRNFSK